MKASRMARDEGRRAGAKDGEIKPKQEHKRQEEEYKERSRRGQGEEVKEQMSKRKGQPWSLTLCGLRSKEVLVDVFDYCFFCCLQCFCVSPHCCQNKIKTDSKPVKTTEKQRETSGKQLAAAPQYGRPNYPKRSKASEQSRGKAQRVIAVGGDACRGGWWVLVVEEGREVEAVVRKKKGLFGRLVLILVG